MTDQLVNHLADVIRRYNTAPYGSGGKRTVGTLEKLVFRTYQVAIIALYRALNGRFQPKTTCEYSDNQLIVVPQ